MRALGALIRRGPEHYLLDRLLIGAVIERRGNERFGLIAQALPDGADRRFFEAITASEARHWQLFVGLAQRECAHADHGARLAELAEAEAEIMLKQPARAALH